MSSLLEALTSLIFRHLWLSSEPPLEEVPMPQNHKKKKKKKKSKNKIKTRKKTDDLKLNCGQRNDGNTQSDAQRASVLSPPLHDDEAPQEMNPNELNANPVNEQVTVTCCKQLMKEETARKEDPPSGEEEDEGVLHMVHASDSQEEEEEEGEALGNASLPPAAPTTPSLDKFPTWSPESKDYGMAYHFNPRAYGFSTDTLLNRAQHAQLQNRAAIQNHRSKSLDYDSILLSSPRLTRSLPVSPFLTSAMPRGSATSPGMLGGSPGQQRCLQLPDSPDAAPDLERLLQAVTPHIPLSKETTLGEVWSWYNIPSLHGLEVETLGGPSGPSTAHFIPFVSSIQLYVPVEEGKGESDALWYAGTTGQDWPHAMKLAFGWSAQGHIGQRLPFNQQIVNLSMENMHIKDLHPYSWYAVAWYPLYRIPEAPLTARFLTFHSVAPLWEGLQHREDETTTTTTNNDNSTSHAVTYRHALLSASLRHDSSTTTTRGGESCEGKSGNTDATPCEVAGFPLSPQFTDGSSAPRKNAGRAASAGSLFNLSSLGTLMNDTPPLISPAASEMDVDEHSSIELAPIGLCWYGDSLKENWKETLVAVDHASLQMPRAPSRIGTCDARLVCHWRGMSVFARSYPLAKGGSMSWDIQVEELEEGARALSLGAGLIPVHEESDQPTKAPVCCPDFIFFKQRQIL